MHDVKVKDVVMELIKRWYNGNQLQKIKMMDDHITEMKLTN
jgi:hypothetical protein